MVHTISTRNCGILILQTANETLVSGKLLYMES